MAVRSTFKLERVRRPDGTRPPVDSPVPVLSPITGAAMAAVRGSVVQPAVSASICFESTATLQYATADDVEGVAVRVVGFGPDTAAWLAREGSAAWPNAGHRANAGWKPWQLDVSPLDSGYQADPFDFPDQAFDAGYPMVLYPRVTPLARAVRNPEGAASGTAWTTTGGTYSRVTNDSTLPVLGLPNPNAAHRVTYTTVTTLGTLVSPTGTVRYRVSPGRRFTAAGWVTSNAVGDAYRVSMTFTGSGVTAFTITGAPTTVTGPTRVVGTGVAPATVTPGAVYTSVVVRVERVGAVTQPANPVTVWANVRGVHAYAGGDRGDLPGLAAVPIPTELAVDVTVPVVDRFRVSRVDVHGSDTYGHPTSITVTRPGDAPVHAASPGRVSARFPTGVLNTTVSPDVRVYVEEAAVGLGGDVYLQTVELLNEVDVTDRVVNVSVDRSTDADPADSTVPIGNYAATTCTLTLDNTDRALSPFRAAYIDLGHRVEVAAGVRYTNRHNDPHGEGLGTLARVLPWVGTLVPVAADDGGTVPPGATRMVVADRAGGTAVQGPGAPGWQVRVGVWARGSGAAAGLRIGYRTATGVIPLAGHIIAAGAGWRRYEATGVLPASATMVAVTADPDVALASPDITRLDPATGDVIEVEETAPMGVFTSTEWPTATDEDTITVPCVDVLGAHASDPMPPTLMVGQTVGDTLEQMFRVHLDRGVDQVVIAEGTPEVRYIVPAEDVGTMVADLAKAAALTAYTDGDGRPVAVNREVAGDVVEVEYRHDNALIRAAVPFTPALVRNDVTVIGRDLTVTPPGVVVGAALNTEPSAPTDTDTVWSVTGSEVEVPAGGSVQVTVPYLSDGALEVTGVEVWAYDAAMLGNTNPTNLAVDGWTGPPDITEPTWTTTGPALVTARVQAFATYAVVTVTADTVNAPPGGFPAVYAPTVLVDHVRLIGTGLVGRDITRRVTRESSVARYGRRPIELRTRIPVPPASLTTVGRDVLDNYSLRDDTGERWLPDLEVSTLGDPWRELGDRVFVLEPQSGIGGEFRVVSHVLDVGSASRSELYVRRVPAGVTFLVLDSSTLDGPHVLAY